MIIALLATIVDQLVTILQVVRMVTEEDLVLEIGLIKDPLAVRVTINRNGCQQTESQAEIEVILVGVLTQSIGWMELTQMLIQLVTFWVQMFKINTIIMIQISMSKVKIHSRHHQTLKGIWNLVMPRDLKTFTDNIAMPSIQTSLKIQRLDNKKYVFMTFLWTWTWSVMTRKRTWWVKLNMEPNSQQFQLEQYISKRASLYYHWEQTLIASMIKPKKTYLKIYLRYSVVSWRWD